MTTWAKRLGYGGSAVIAGSQVLITSGSFEQANSPSFLEMLDIDPSMQQRGRVLHAEGVSSFTGSLSFDLTPNAMNKFTTSTLLDRGYQFNVGINDGGVDADTGLVMSDCYVTSLSLSGAPGGLISSSVSFMAKSASAAGTVTNTYILDDYTSSIDNQPLAYWWSGGADVKEWTFTMNQAVEPVYLNKNTPSPKYLRVGLVDYQLDTTLYSGGIPASIKIYTSTFALTGVTSAIGYTFNGVTDLGTYSHSFITAGNIATGSGDTVLIVS